MKNITDFIIESLCFNEAYSPKGNFDSIQDVIDKFIETKDDKYSGFYVWDKLKETDFSETTKEDVENIFFSRKKRYDYTVLLYKNANDKFCAYSIFGPHIEKNPDFGGPNKIETTLATLNFIEDRRGNIKPEVIGPEGNPFQSVNDWSRKTYYNKIKNYKAYKAVIKE